MEKIKEKTPKTEHIGIYGGTFSPPHIGHMHAARVFLREGGIDSLMVIPTFVTPLKERNEQTSAHDRLEMCRLAFSFSPRITVSDIEVCRAGHSNTAETITVLHSPTVELSFLCGTDMLLTMDKWHDPETIFRLARIVCMRRENDAVNGELLAQKAEEYRVRFGATVEFLNAPPLTLSSSEIRMRLLQGEDCREYLDQSVLDYIRERGLYL